MSYFPTKSVQDKCNVYDWTRTVNSLSPKSYTVTSGQTDTGDISTVKYASRSGSKTPNYRAIVKAGGVLPVNSLTFEKFESSNDCQAMLTSFSGGANGWTREVRVVVKRNQYVETVPTNPFTQFDLGNRLLKKARGAEWNLPVFFAELGKTAGMVTKSAIRITEMMLLLRKGNLAGFIKLFHPSAKVPRERAFRRAKYKFDKNFGRDPAKAVSGAWLEFKYGWMPFLKDVDDAFALLSDIQNRDDAFISSVRTKVPLQIFSSFTSQSLTSLAGVGISGTALTQYDLSGSATWRFKIKEFGLIHKLGLTNPAVVAWELVPLSFVADWFVPIGDYLASLDAPLRFTHVSGAWGYKAQMYTIYTGLKATSPGWVLNYHSEPGTKRLYVERRVMTGIPSPKFTSLTFRAKLGTQQAVSAVALLSQTASNVFRRKA